MLVWSRRSTILVVLIASVLVTAVGVLWAVSRRGQPGIRDLEAERAAAMDVDWGASGTPLELPEQSLQSQVATLEPDALTELQRDGRNEDREPEPLDDWGKPYPQLGPYKFYFDRLPYGYYHGTAFSVYYKKSSESIQQFVNVIERTRNSKGYESTVRKATEHLIHDLVKQEATPEEVRTLQESAVDSLASVPPESPHSAATQAYIFALHRLCRYHLEERTRGWGKGAVVFDLGRRDVFDMFKHVLTVAEVNEDAWSDPRRGTYQILLEATGDEEQKLALMTLALDGVVRRNEGLFTLLWMLEAASNWLGRSAESRTEPREVTARADFALAAIRRMADASEYAELTDIEPIGWFGRYTASTSVSTLDQLLRCAAALTSHLPQDQRPVEISKGLKACLDKLDGVAYFTDHAAKTRALLRSAGWDV